MDQHRILTLTVLLRRSSIKWIFTMSFKKNLYGLHGSLKSFSSIFLSFMSKVKSVNRFQLSGMFIHWLTFKFIVKQNQLWTISFLSRWNITLTLHLEINVCIVCSSKIIGSGGIAPWLLTNYVSIWLWLFGTQICKTYLERTNWCI